MYLEKLLCDIRCMRLSNYPLLVKAAANKMLIRMKIEFIPQHSRIDLVVYAYNIPAASVEHEP